jgi:class 3 adenylate cyclase
MSTMNEGAHFFTAEMAESFRNKYSGDPGYAARWLEDMLELLPQNSMPEEEYLAVRAVIDDLRCKEAEREMPASQQENELLSEILDFYVPRQLVKSIVAKGSIPQDSEEAFVGVGFIDIADYSYLAKFLSPKENQTVLNGLYSCFAEILRRRGGYLNKSEGDSIMFQFGGPLDPQTKEMDVHGKDAFDYSATQLFNTCVEMQRLCYKFNDADESILYFLNDEEERENLKEAFNMLQRMRTDPFLSNAFNAIYQIRIRIGANVGPVNIGNFGPPGSKHWDIIGNPVIEAKRMESTSPIGGLRIAESFYKALDERGIVDEYYRNFLAEAKKLNGYFRDIKKEEVFQYGAVLLKDKKNVSFRTYSVQVHPGLPEALLEQVSLLLEKGETGADKIVELVKYYRGNKQVIEALEDLFRQRGIKLRKGKLVFYLFPEKYQSSLRIMGGDRTKVEEFIEQKYKLYDVLKTLGGYQDKLKLPFLEDEKIVFESYDQYMDLQLQSINSINKRSIKNSIHNTYFFNVIFPLIFKSLKASIIEFQAELIEKEAAQGAVLLDGMNDNLVWDDGLEPVSDVEEAEELEEAEPV